MRWIYVRNAVKYFLTKIHRIHRISYKNSPKNLDPGINDSIKPISFGPLCDKFPNLNTNGLYWE